MYPLGYDKPMYDIIETPVFSRWLRQVRDIRARTRILTRIDRAREGNLGDVSPVGNGISEMRIFVGKGYRVYFTMKGQTLVLLLCGGDKGTRASDIKRANQLLNELVN